MASLLFIHGTGQRRDSVSRSLEKFCAHAKQHPLLAPLAIENCLWGDPFGSQIGEGLSVPDYAEGGGAGQRDAAELDVELWANLYADPLYELRLLALQPSQARGLPGASAGDRLNQYLSGLTITSDLHSALVKGDVLSVFGTARTEVVRSVPYREMLRAAADPLGPFQDALARALAAMSIALFRDVNHGIEPTIQEDQELRDACVRAICNDLGPYQAAIFEPLVHRFHRLRTKVYWGTATALLAPGIAMLGRMPQQRRREMMYGASPLAGDILAYQCRGADIQRFIAFRIREVPPPVAIVAHSLGGVAAVDVLVQENLQERVRLLVTVGSQAPYFYEINALQSLERRAEAKLPCHFPAWINIYDLRDFLSFIGAGLFPGGVIDREVDSRQPFPVSHSAYWTNKDTYRIIADGVDQYLGPVK